MIQKIHRPMGEVFTLKEIEEVSVVLVIVELPCWLCDIIDKEFLFYYIGHSNQNSTRVWFT